MLHLLGVLWRYASVKHGEKLKNNIFYSWEGRCIRIILETFCAIIIHSGTVVLHIGILALALGPNIIVGTSACTMQDDQSILMMCLIMQLVSVQHFVLFGCLPKRSLVYMHLFIHSIFAYFKASFTHSSALIDYAFLSVVFCKII